MANINSKFEILANNRALEWVEQTIYKTSQHEKADSIIEDYLKALVKKDLTQASDFLEKIRNNINSASCYWDMVCTISLDTAEEIYKTEKIDTPKNTYPQHELGVIDVESILYSIQDKEDTNYERAINLLIHFAKHTPDSWLAADALKTVIQKTDKTDRRKNDLATLLYQKSVQMSKEVKNHSEDYISTAINNMVEGNKHKETAISFMFNAINKEHSSTRAVKIINTLYGNLSDEGLKATLYQKMIGMRGIAHIMWAKKNNGLKLV